MGFAEDTVTIIEAPFQSDPMMELIKRLKPQVVVTGMASFEAIISSAFENLLNVTREIGSRFLFLDISDHLELSSLPGSNGVLKYLTGRTLPSHAAILCGPVKNQVYGDLEVVFVISEDETIFNALSKTMELLAMKGLQLCLASMIMALFHDLLAFQIVDRRPTAERVCVDTKSAEMIGFASSTVSTLDDAELSIGDTNDTTMIYMNVDQSFLPIPSAV